MNKRHGLCAAFILFAAVLLNAQTGNKIELLLQENTVSCRQAARIVLEAAGIDVDYSDPDQAYNFAVEKRWLSARTSPDDIINIRQTSLLLMRAFNLRGGPMYTIFKSPHFAYREMVYHDLLQGRIDPGMDVPGELMLFLVNRVLYRTDADPWSLPHVPPVLEKLPQAKRVEYEALLEDINAELRTLAVDDVFVRFTETGIIINLSNMQFLANSGTLQEKEKHVLRGIGHLIKTVLSRKILVLSSAKLTKAEEDRLRASMERALSVADYLIGLRAREAHELFIQAFGSEPAAKDARGGVLNRRVEITTSEDRE